MSFYTPNTAVHLCNVPLTLNKSNQFCPNDWTLNDQTSWFNQHTLHTVTDFTYQRKDNIIRVGINADQLRAEGINYCYYQNVHYGDKRFYCYITLIEFINENCSHLHIKTDVFQTWLFDMKLNTTFVARQTVLNDDMFKYTLPENVPIGDTIIANSEDITERRLTATSTDNYYENYIPCIVCSQSFTNAPDVLASQAWASGSPNECVFYGVKDGKTLYQAFNELSNQGLKDGIVTAFSVPRFVVSRESYNPYSAPTTINPPYYNIPSAQNHKGSPFSQEFTVSQSFHSGHNGIDMWCSNRNIYANTAGVVTFARYDDISSPERSYGYLVIIKSTSFPKTDGGDWYFWYAHLEENSIAVQEGQTVSMGDFIGVEGDSGDSDGYHLHWGVGETTLPTAYPSNWQNPVYFGCSFPNSEGTY